MRWICLTLLLFPLCVAAEDKSGPVVEAKSANRRLPIEELKKFYAEEKDRITTDWVPFSLSEALFQAFWTKSYVPVMVESKQEDGQDYYRFGFKHLTDAYPDAAPLGLGCYYGMTKDAFDQRNQDLQKSGYVLMQMQVTEDGDGSSSYSAVWANPAGPRKKKQE